MEAGSIVEEINRRLAAIEETEGVKILFAAEAGSRGWDLHSKYSDYDARFIYVRPMAWYLSLEKGRKATMEVQAKVAVDAKESENGAREVVLDFFGYDVDKALTLLRESNPALLDWLRSPAVYREDSQFVEPAKALSVKFFSKKSLAHHYLSMAKKHQHLHFDNKGAVIRLKKYFFVLRPLHCIRWMKAHEGLPPLSFGETLSQIEVPEEILAEITKLKEKKQTSTLGEGERIAIIDGWIKDSFDEAAIYCKELWQLQRDAGVGSDLPPWEEFDNLFYQTVTSSRD